jgi:hypothetical protein
MDNGMSRILLLTAFAAALSGQTFHAGFARRDITPREPVPMWGYGSRHAAPSEGILDPLSADALVLDAAGAKLAIVGLDLGRAPAEASLQRIRTRIENHTGIRASFIAGSHTHHGPVLELSDAPGKGKGRFDAALRYYREMEDAIVAAVVEADQRLAPAHIAAGSAQLHDFNVNRHTRLAPKPGDRELALLRVDTLDGRPLALVINFAAHPTTLPDTTLKFSADYAGALKNAVARDFGGAAIFIQGAAGDQSVNREKGVYREYGEALAREVVRLARQLKPAPVSAPSLTIREERLRFDSRINLADPLVMTAFSMAFFPELVQNFKDEYIDGVRPRLTVALLNGDIALVGVSGEFFSNHAVRLKERARVKHLFFFGYCNGYHQYFPTIEAVAEGGYGADAPVAPAAVGAGEQVMNTALIWLYRMQGRIKP